MKKALWIVAAVVLSFVLLPHLLSATLMLVHLGAWGLYLGGVCWWIWGMGFAKGDIAKWLAPLWPGFAVVGAIRAMSRKSIAEPIKARMTATSEERLSQRISRSAD